MNYIFLALLITKTQFTTNVTPIQFDVSNPQACDAALVKVKQMTVGSDIEIQHQCITK